MEDRGLLMVDGVRNDNWPLRRLDSIVEFRGGGTPSKRNSNYWNGDIPWVSPKDMKSREINTSIDFITEKAVRESAARMIPRDAILIVVRSGILARKIPVARTTRELTINQDLKALCPSPDILPDYLLYYFDAYEDLIRKKVTRGATVHRLTTEVLKSLPIPLPPLPEQRRIVAILDEVFEGIDRAIANTEQNLANARELFESYLNRVFIEKGEGWVERKLGEVCHISSSLVDPRLDEYANCPHIGAGNIESVTGTLSAVLSAQEEGLISGKFFFDQRMVLYSKIRPYLRKIARPHFDGLCSADIYPLDPDPILISRDFLFFLLLSPQFTEYAINGSARAGMPKVNRNHLFNYKSQMPPIDEQAGITSYLDRLAVQVHDLQSHYTRKLASLAELKQSILRKAFSGELTGAGDQTSEVLKTSEV